MYNQSKSRMACHHPASGQKKWWDIYNQIRTYSQLFNVIPWYRFEKIVKKSGEDWISENRPPPAEDRNYDFLYRAIGELFELEQKIIHYSFFDDYEPDDRETARKLRISKKLPYWNAAELVAAKNKITIPPIREQNPLIRLIVPKSSPHSVPTLVCALKSAMSFFQQF